MVQRLAGLNPLLLISHAVEDDTSWAWNAGQSSLGCHWFMPQTEPMSGVILSTGGISTGWGDVYPHADLVTYPSLYGASAMPC